MEGSELLAAEQLRRSAKRPIRAGGRKKSPAVDGDGHADIALGPESSGGGGRRGGRIGSAWLRRRGGAQERDRGTRPADAPWDRCGAARHRRHRRTASSRGMEGRRVI